MSMSRASMSLRKMAKGTYGGQSRVASPSSRKGVFRPIGLNSPDATNEPPPVEIPVYSDYSIELFDASPTTFYTTSTVRGSIFFDTSSESTTDPFVTHQSGVIVSLLADYTFDGGQVSMTFDPPLTGELTLGIVIVPNAALSLEDYVANSEVVVSAGSSSASITLPTEHLMDENSFVMVTYRNSGAYVTTTVSGELRFDFTTPPPPVGGGYYIDIEAGQTFLGSGGVGVYMDPDVEFGATDDIFVDPDLPTFIWLPGGITITDIVYEISWGAGTSYANPVEATIHIYSNPDFDDLFISAAGGTDVSGVGQTLHVEGTEDYVTLGDAFPFIVPPEGAFIGPGFRRGTNPDLTATGGYFTFLWEG